MKVPDRPAKIQVPLSEQPPGDALPARAAPPRLTENTPLASIVPVSVPNATAQACGTNVRVEAFCSRFAMQGPLRYPSNVRFHTPETSRAAGGGSTPTFISPLNEPDRPAKIQVPLSELPVADALPASAAPPLLTENTPLASMVPVSVPNAAAHAFGLNVRLDPFCSKFAMQGPLRSPSNVRFHTPDRSRGPGDVGVLVGPPGVAVAVGVGVSPGVSVGVGVGVSPGVSVAVAVGVSFDVAVGVEVGVFTQAVSELGFRNKQTLYPPVLPLSTKSWMISTCCPVLVSTQFS